MGYIRTETLAVWDGEGRVTPATGAAQEKAVESVTVTVKLKFPEAVGVPESNPVDDKVSPAGKAPTVSAKVYGSVPPLAVN